MIEFTPSNIKLWSRLGANGAFGLAAMELPEQDNAIVMLTADLSQYSGLERFRKQYPDRFYNLGIAEQNMIGVAAGMAKEGLKPFANTYASFAASRCLDQVRVNMGYMKLPIKLIGLTSGLSVGILGSTHMSLEDIAVMRAIPNINIISPADCAETVKAVLALAKYDGPVYLRLTGIPGTPIVYNDNYDFTIGKANQLREGKDICIFATGSMVYYALESAKVLDTMQISCKVIDMHTIKPLDKDVINKSLGMGLIVTIEEHSINGGLGGAVAEFLSEKKTKPPLLIVGLADEFKHAGSYDFLLEQYGLTTKTIVQKILNKFKEN